MTEPRLAASFEWDEPARLLPTRRDAISEACSNRLDGILQRALQESLAMGPGAPTEALLASQREFHEVYGQYLSHNLEANRIRPSCGRGCSRCCHHYVSSVHALEVLAIYEQVRLRSDLNPLMEACRSRAKDLDGWEEFCEETYPERSADDRADLALEHYYDEGLPCPFLNEGGACGIYEDRPLTCRMYLAVSDPSFCEPERLTQEASDVFTVPPDESVAARIVQLDEAIDYWGHTQDLFRSLSKLHAWRMRWCRDSQER